jgi:hypothetical protein
MKKEIVRVISINSGVPDSTIHKWLLKEPALREIYKEKYSRRKKNFGSGKKPAFPNSEARLAAEIKKRRAEHKCVTKLWALAELRKFSREENPELYQKLKVDDDVFYGFLVRQGFSFRKPSNTKSISKSEATQRLRGFWLWLIDLFSGKIPITLGTSSSIDPVFGRFPLSCRWNKDEVPLPFGDVAKILSVTGERATVLRVLEGWGDRICTLILNIGWEGLILPVGVIFKGTGQKLKDEEWARYSSLKNIAVSFQEKAWVDTRIELKLVERMIKPAVSRLRATFPAGEFPGVILIQDNFKPHFAECVCFYNSLHHFCSEVIHDLARLAYDSF